MTYRALLGGLLAVLLVASCGGSSGDECSPACGPCEQCYFGTCVPDPRCDGGTDGVGEADGAADADGDGDVWPDAGPDADGDDTGPAPDADADGDDEAGPGPDADADGDEDADDGSGGDDAGRPDIDAEDAAGPEGEDAARPDADDAARPDADEAARPDADAGRMCGPWPGGECAEGYVCDITGCWPGASGTCVPRPTSCPGVWMPVCGCDGNTYGNDCYRLEAGVPLDHEGECGTVEPMDEPVCAPDGTRWVYPDGGTVCRVDCAGCVAVCMHEGSFSEGWYAVCADPTKDAGCVPFVDNLIAWTDCSP